MRRTVTAVAGTVRAIDLNPRGAELVNLLGVMFATVNLTLLFWTWVLR